MSGFGTQEQYFSSSSSSSTASQYTYDVFLSFRGQDTRKTFTDHLYTALVQAGLRTFRDDEAIAVGENIKIELRKAIQESRVSIVVLSKDYASSSWCLDELVMILKRKRASGHVVLPVFYEVDPFQVRKRFARHEERFKEEVGKRKIDWVDKVNEWRAALDEIAELGGMVLKDQADGHESKFIQKIVKVVEDKLSRTILSVAPYLVGIHSRIESINLWLQDGSSTDVGIAAICGMGGIGKTTIAKFVYNLNFSGFDGHSFLANIREISEQHNGLIRLQRQLLSDILRGRKEKIYSIDHGIVRIKDAICCKRVLVVLDDVDKVEQLDAILGMRDWFFQGTKIIITTRHERLLRAREAYKIHKVEQLNEVESLELFSWHAFGKDHPIDGYVEDSKKVVYYCGGLPLAIEVLGSSLSGRSLDVWKSQFEKLKSIPDSRILEKLKISYDSLQDDHDKNLFLHIVSFFIRKDKDLTVEILDKCDFYTSIGIQNLIDRCLLRIDAWKKLAMHQLVEDMGREIIRQESPEEPGKRSRLCNHEDSFNVLREKTGTEEIEGLSLDMHLLKKNEFPRKDTGVNRKRRFEKFIDDSLLSQRCNSRKRHHSGIFYWHPVSTAQGNSNKIVLETIAFAKMHKLALLQLNFVQLNGSYEEFPKRLRWLCWHGFPFKSIPNDFPLESLVALDMRHSNLKNVWEKTKVFGLLKILNLSHCHRLARTDFSVVPNLEKLILKDCASLVEVDESIGILKRLATLNLKDCTSLRKFPRNMNLLKSLEELNISGCSNLDEMPIEMVKMKSLKVFHADRTAMSQLLSTPGELKSWPAFVWSWIPKPKKIPEMWWSSFPCSLVNLSLADCNLTNDAFPQDFSNLPSLQNLNLSRNSICSLPDCIRGLTGLQMLRFESCARLQSLVGLPRTDILSVAHCASLERITFMLTSSSPSILDQTDCDKLVEIMGDIKLEPVGKVDAEIANILGLQNFESMTNVELNFFNGISSNKTERRPIQGLHEYGIFSTFFPGREVPGWFSNRTTGCSKSFTVPSPPNHRIRGLNVCCVYALSNKQEIWWPPPLFMKIVNKSRSLKWIYGPSGFVIPEGNEDVIWLSQWKFKNDHLECGDEVNVTIVVDVGFQVKECGINHVYEQEEDSQNSTINSSHQIVPYGNIEGYGNIGGVYILGIQHCFSCQGSSRKYNWNRLDWSKKLLEDVEVAKVQVGEEEEHGLSMAFADARS